MHADMNDWSERLGALAGFEPPAAGWKAVAAARDQRDARQNLRWPMMLAVAVLAAAAGLGWWLQSAQRALATVSDAAEHVGVPVAAEMRAANDRLEWLLATLPERRAMRGSTAYTVAELEDRLALLDDRLSVVSLEPNAPERAERLWRERVEVMHSLVRVRYADAVGNF
ncbi:MAG TPA: hypothetical protein VGA24_06185 [Steroidobacteraceae bacterium]